MPALQTTRCCCAPCCTIGSMHYRLRRLHTCTAAANHLQVCSLTLMDGLCTSWHAEHKTIKQQVLAVMVTHACKHPMALHLAPQDHSSWHQLLANSSCTVAPHILLLQQLIHIDT